MKILITGTDGYIGCIVAPLLLREGFDLVAIDTGYYKTGWLYNGAAQSARTIAKDIRNITKDDLYGCKAVVHLAELSNDPTGQLAPHITHEINHKASVRLATLAKEAGVERFVYMSSCSVYGVANSPQAVTEESPVNPQTAYAECKVLVERDLKPMAAPNFSPTFLRNATAFGASPRQRFDLVLNNLAGLAYTTRKIAMTSDGTPWRPLVHIQDMAKAILCVLRAPKDVIHNRTFNVGSSEQNYQVKDIATIVGREFPGCEVTFGTSGADNRSYRVNFDRITNELPGFKCDWDAQRGAQQFAELFDRIQMTKEEFESRGFTRLKQLEYLIKTGQIDNNFFWTKPAN
jgi:nucleoside-diphosphate-sugar epimerase